MWGVQVGEKIDDPPPFTTRRQARQGEKKGKASNTLLRQEERKERKPAIDHSLPKKKSCLGSAAPFPRKKKKGKVGQPLPELTSERKKKKNASLQRGEEIAPPSLSLLKLEGKKGGSSMTPGEGGGGGKLFSEREWGLRRAGGKKRRGKGRFLQRGQGEGLHHMTGGEVLCRRERKTEKGSLS